MEVISFKSLTENTEYYLNFARVGGFHMQEEPLSTIKLDASSRFAGALKGEGISFS